MEQLKTIRNGAAVQPTFSAAEMERRLAALRAHMAERRIDACLFTSHHNIAYFSDFLYTSFARLFGLVVTQDGQTTITPNVDGAQPWRRTFGDNLVYTDWHRDNYFAAVKTLIPDGWRVGIEFDHISVENLRKLQGALPTSELVDAGKPAMRMRMVKSDEEVAWIREGARIADIGGAAAVEAIAVGVPEYEVALHATRSRPCAARRSATTPARTHALRRGVLRRASAPVEDQCRGPRGRARADPPRRPLLRYRRREPAPCGASGHLVLAPVRHQQRRRPQPRHIVRK